jgi:polysaccharide deacetylase 2 family uncharacterized protein YibQ
MPSREPGKRRIKLTAASGSGRPGKRGKKQKPTGFYQWVAFFTAAAAAGLIFYLLIPADKPLPPVPEGVSVPAPPLPDKLVAVIIDDLGHNRRAARPFIETPYPVALSILPGRPFSENLAAEALKKGKTLLLHLPMEPVGYPGTNPGPGAVLVSQDRREIQRIIAEDLASLPGIVGINNHMGSRATADRDTMDAVLEFVQREGLFFVDSRTTPETVGLARAREMGIPSAERDVFLDNVAEPSAIDDRIDELLDLALEKGWALGIGHAHPLTAEALTRLADRAKERGITWISLEGLISYADPGNRDIMR